MKEYNEKRSNLGLKICLVVLSILVIGLSGFIVYDKFISENNNQNKTEEKDKNNATPTPTNKPSEASKTEAVNLNDEQISLLINYIMNIYDNESEIYGVYRVAEGRSKDGLFYHKNDKQIINNIDSNIKLEMLSSKIYNEYMTSSGIYEKTFTKAEVDKLYHELFGLSASSIKYTSNTCPSLTEENGKVIVKSGCGNILGPGYHYSIITQFYKAEKTANELYLYQLVGYPKYDNESNLEALHSFEDDFTIYKDFDLTTKTSGTNKKLYDENIKFQYANHGYNLTKIKEELDSYKYTFKLEDGNYYFYSVEKMK